MPLEKERIYIHVGYPKAGSSTLQKHLFSKHPEINYLGIYPISNIGINTKEVDLSCLYLNNKHLRNFYRNLIYCDEIEYESSGNIELYINEIKGYLKKDKINLFSNEALTDSYSADRGVKAKRLKNIFPDAKVLLIIRSQINIIKSQYKDQPFDPICRSSGKAMNINKWLNKSFNHIDRVKFINSLKYYDTIKFYSDLFGKDNIKIMLFEELVEKISLFSKNISEFMRIDHKKTKKLIIGKHENVSVSNFYNYLRCLKRMTGLKFTKFEFLKKIGRKDIFINNEWDLKIKKFYKNSNLKLKKEYNVNEKLFNKFYLNGI